MSLKPTVKNDLTSEVKKLSQKNIGTDGYWLLKNTLNQFSQFKYLQYSFYYNTCFSGSLFSSSFLAEDEHLLPIQVKYFK